MIDQEIKIVQHTWGYVATNEEPSIGDLFYAHLFEKCPSLKSIFKHEPAAYSRKFITMMNCLIRKLDDTSIIHEARKLGEKYAEHGIQREHYDYMKEALFYALRKKLGSEWNPTVMVSWIWFYSTLSFIMKDAGSGMSKQTM